MYGTLGIYMAHRVLDAQNLNLNGGISPTEYDFFGTYIYIQQEI